MSKERSEAGLALCADGVMHGFSMLDDGYATKALCGRDVSPMGGGSDDSEVCKACIPLLGKELRLSDGWANGLWP